MPWYCLHTKPRCEAPVASYCREVVGADVYLPRLRQLRLVRRRRVPVTEALFPRYLFCRIDESLSFRAVRYAPEVLDIVGRGGEPAPVADAIVAELRRWAGDLLDATAAAGLWRSGEAARVAEGPLLGLTGTVLAAHEDGRRVELLLALLHEGARVTVDASALERVRTA